MTNKFWCRYNKNKLRAIKELNLYNKTQLYFCTLFLLVIFL